MDESDLFSNTQNNTDQLNVNQAPTFQQLKLVCTCADDFIVDNKEFQQCLKGCKWSPDGTCVLTNSEDKFLRIFNLGVDDADQRIRLYKTAQIKEGGTIYDYAWHPNVHANENLVLSTSNRSPIHLWNAKDGKLVATYRVYDHVDEVAHVNSLCFNWSGDEIYCGSLGKINIFRTDRPGREFIEIPTKSDFHKTIISTIAMNPVDKSVFAVGTYNKDIGIFGGNQLMYILRGHKSGITQISFSPDGQKLYSGARKGDSDIVCWDLRNIGQTLYSVQRSVTTNQRIYFDISSDGQYLVSGNCTGEISTWRLDEKINSEENLESVLELNSKILTHDDCVNGASLHPTRSLLATTSGQRHVEFFNDFDDDDDDCSNKKTSNHFDTSLKLWKII